MAATLVQFLLLAAERSNLLGSDLADAFTLKEYSALPYDVRLKLVEAARAQEESGRFIIDAIKKMRTPQ